MRRKKDDLAGYKPLEWDADSNLSKEEQKTVEVQRKDLWRGGIRTEPILTQMAFEFGAVICMFKEAKNAVQDTEGAGSEGSTEAVEVRKSGPRQVRASRSCSVRRADHERRSRER